MKKYVYVLLAVLTVPMVSAVEIDHTMFGQNDRLSHGESIFIGTQFSSESPMQFGETKLIIDGDVVDRTVLLDRNGDKLYSGKVGTVRGGETYLLEIKGCTVDDECVTETYSKTVSFFEPRGHPRPSILP